MARSAHGALPDSHPAILELSALRHQLNQYQSSAHQTAIQLQGSRLELSLARERNAVVLEQVEALKKELEVLRKNPAPPPIPHSSTALSELSLAHRRLSAKLDLTETGLAASQLESATAKQEIQRLHKERDADRAALNEFQRAEDEREEEIEWERTERKKAEEQKKLCDLALLEYEKIVKSLQLSPELPETSVAASATFILASPSPDTEAPEPDLMTLAAVSPTDEPSLKTVSSLLEGQKGVQRLFADFSSTLASKEKACRQLSDKVDQLQLSIDSLTVQLEAETALRVQAENGRDKALIDDASAARVVERYMTFTQKAHKVAHMHLDTFRTRASVTQASLRQEVAGLRRSYDGEKRRGERLRGAIDEMAETLSREAAGRRREVGLRLKMVSLEEQRARKVEDWLDKVRRAREGAEGAVLEADQLENLLDEGISALSTTQRQAGDGRSWKGLFGKKKEIAEPDTGREDSVARVLLAEELVGTLVADLQVETERRAQLEKERMEWLARDALSGVKPAEGEGEAELMFDADDGGERVHPTNENDGAGEPGTKPALTLRTLSSSTTLAAVATPLPLSSPEPESSPLIGQLQKIFEPLRTRYPTLQSSLHDVAASLTNLRESLPLPPPPEDKKPAIRRPKVTRGLSLRTRHPLSDPTLPVLLDGIHEVIEDARVDVEIAIADEERVLRGFEALLGVGASGTVQGKEVLRDAREYVAERTEWTGFARLAKRVDDAEQDLLLLKRTVHEVEGMAITEEEERAGADGKRKQSVWETLDLRTVTPTSVRPAPSLASPLGSEDLPPSAMELRRPGLFSTIGNTGRTFSASVVGTPRRLGSLAGGLYKGKKAGEGTTTERAGLVGAQADEDGVE